MAQPLGEARITRMATIGSYRLYIETDGKLFLHTGNVKLRVTPQEALELLDYMLTFARYFEQADEPVTGGLVRASGAQSLMP